MLDGEAAGQAASAPFVTPDISSNLQNMKFQAACAALSTPQTSNSVQSWALRLGMSIFKMMQTNTSPHPPLPRSSKNQSTIITLVRPKGVTLPPPAPRQKKPKKKPEYLLESLPRIKRSRSAMLPPRNIHTPDWCDASTDDLEAVDVGPFDIIAAHRSLEICESRIQRGEDPAHHHPALASQASTEDLELSQREREMWARYGEARVDEATPAFWPRRIWDSQDVQMSEAESARLAATLEDVIGADATLRVRKSITAPSPKKQARPKRTSRANHPTALSIDFRNYVTDDDETDWDET
jgi:hypothetical protein